MTTKPKVTAADVLDVLCEKHFKPGAHEFLREVRNGTGWAGDRSADALVISTWPSRGIWFGGIEVKVARSDWQSELAKPAKSSAIQKFCSYWWVATPPDIVRPGELPEAWGHIEVSGKSCRVLKVAPKLAAEPLAEEFVAAVLRNAAKSQDALRQRAEIRGYERAEAKLDGAAVAELRGELVQAQRRGDLAEQDRDRAKSEAERLRAAVDSFELKTGLQISARYWDDHRTQKVFAAAQALNGLDLGTIEGVLRKAADSLRAANEARKSPLETGQEAAS